MSQRAQLACPLLQELGLRSVALPRTPRRCIALPCEPVLELSASPVGQRSRGGRRVSAGVRRRTHRSGPLHDRRHTTSLFGSLVLFGMLYRHSKASFRRYVEANT